MRVDTRMPLDTPGILPDNHTIPPGSDPRSMSEPKTGPPVSEELLQDLYREVREEAACHLRGAPAGPTLQASAAVHEAYLRVNARGVRSLQGRTHFMAVA